MILGNHFPPNPRVWQQRKMKFSGKSFPVDQNLLLWPGNDFTLSFSLQIISGERERERAQIGEREEEDFAGDHRLSSSRTIAPRQSSIAAPRCSWIVPLVDRSIAPLDLVARSRLHRAISSSPPPHDLNLTGFDEFFCWVLFLLWMSVELIHFLLLGFVSFAGFDAFSVKMFEWTKHRN